MKTVIFACVHNEGRSQMAAAFFNLLADPTKARALSAGSEPGQKVRPEVLAAMADIGVDLSSVKPQLLTEAMTREALMLVALGTFGPVPNAPPALQRVDWPLEDPAGKSQDEVQKIRDQIAAMVAGLVQGQDWERPPA
ncbi:arsenate reductase ArsC [Corallococcus sp. H22C18031201]|uniref:arsenate reductase/protein-tyrosine-phosphatase family protein n=1 Tax=Citreicoccus inhibens TaxID=2849499 RepID=UPI000E749D6F|nr:arsenate reductase ArsC [Citreicoccus inhibens]MBU8895883.1 arsenate reductase ArsC [Citreicoccus inhibens]RJS23886.1 arsenate reductase ArsC [Corallococcus sp. H22C18031201]